MMEMIRLKTDKTQIMSVQSIPKRMTACKWFLSARIPMLTKNWATGDCPFGAACSPSGIRFNLITEYRVIALTTCRGPSAKTIRSQASNEKYVNRAT